MIITDFNQHKYDSNKHWHVGYYENNMDIEGVGFQRKEDGTWDLFYNDFIEDSEYAALVNESSQRDEYFGVLLFNSPENEVAQRFHEWVKKVLLPFRNLSLIMHDETGCKCEKPTKYLRLEADFSADPIWCDICDGNLDLITLPLSIELKKELEEWITKYGQWINWDTDQLVANAHELEKAHNESGLKLFQKTKSELGNGYYLNFSPSTSVALYSQRNQL